MPSPPAPNNALIIIYMYLYNTTLTIVIILANSVGDKLVICFLIFFFQKTVFDISCKLVPLECLTARSEKLDHFSLDRFFPDPFHTLSNETSYCGSDIGIMFPSLHLVQAAI